MVKENQERVNTSNTSEGNPAIPIGIMGFTLFVGAMLSSLNRDSSTNYTPRQRNPEVRDVNDPNDLDVNSLKYTVNGQDIRNYVKGQR